MNVSPRLLLLSLALLLMAPGERPADDAPAPDKPAAEAGAEAEPEPEAKPPTVPELIAQLRSPDASTRSKAAEALGLAKAEQAVPGLIPLLDDPDEDAQWKATVALSNIGTPAAPALIEALAVEKERSRWKAETALKMIAADAVPALADALKDRRARIRQSAAFLLGEIKDARSLPALAAALGDKDHDTRWKAATSLTKFGAQATDVIAKTLASDSIEARRCAAWVVQQTRDPAAVSALVRALADRDEQVRWKAAIALQK
ncbi:HEAT repeat domain-containing protein, partial [bacterium]|nr:HEAT repeat domain-containing protein [bacterium]